MFSTLSVIVTCNLLLLASTLTQQPTISPTLSLDDYPTDMEVIAYASSMHYWYQGQQHNGRRVYQGDGWSETDPRVIRWTGTYWLISKTIEMAGYFALCDKDNLFECNGEITIKYCFNGYQSDGEYIINGTYNGRWRFQAVDIDRFIHYYLDDASWKITDLHRNKIYATCNQQNIFDCQTGIEFSTCRTRVPTAVPTQSPTLTSPSPSDNPTTLPSASPTTIDHPIIALGSDSTTNLFRSSVSTTSLIPPRSSFELPSHSPVHRLI